MEKKTHISVELENWIRNTLKTGVHPEAIVNGLIKKGYDTRLAYRILLNIVANHPVSASNTSYQYETPELGIRENVLYTSDREIRVLMRNEKPYVLHLDNVLSSEECDRLISLSMGRLQPSKVVDPKTGIERSTAGRTSHGMYFSLNENSFLTTIEKRIAEITNIPMEHGEGLQVLNYKNDQEYKPHFDYFPSSKVDPEKGGQRVGTLLIYLNDVPDGGQTIFPKLGLSIVPKKGTAVYFHYTNSLGQVDPMSLHSSSPVLKGEKWVATKWIRQGNIYPKPVKVHS
ncbi:2OG-Fe(II) oxygenase [Bacillus sp. PS06]|uniref:2OG-Fe(II) oxygenase n=1 Tax=Bacillus sp. PS06 TaxID=2764176 RepID=UPI001CD8DE09|nr:2OG-Fe(II) oxygenase [Bacillus sp. PS06]